MQYSYAVVKFLIDIDHTVEVVPTNWLKDNDTVCLWPTLTSPRLMKAIRNKEEPGQDWAVEEFAAKVLYRTGEGINFNIHNKFPIFWIC